MEKHMEYSKLVSLLNQSDPHDIYEELMKKETHVLDTVNRVVNYSNEKQVKNSEFANTSINDIAHKLFWNIRLISMELFDVKNVQDLKRVLLKDDRKIYVGLTCVIISLFLFFIIIST